jgi:uncharacterized protein (TIGR02246 family)
VVACLPRRRSATTLAPGAKRQRVRKLVDVLLIVQLGRLLGSSVDARSASQGGSHRACAILRCLMSEESTTPDPVELLGRAVEAANRRDLDAAASSFAEDATFDGRALGDHFQGRAAIRSFLEDWFGTYEELEFGLEEVRDLGNGVVFAVVVQNRSSGWQRRSPSTTRGMGVRLGRRLDRTPYDLRGRGGPCCRRTPRAGAGVGDAAGEREIG